MKKHIFLIVGLLISLSVNASDWVPHYSYEKDILGVERIGDIVYAISDGKLFSYNSQTKDYDKILKQSNNDSIVAMVSHAETKRLLILSDHFVFDVFDGTAFHNIPTLVHTNLLTDDTINDVNSAQNVAFVSTNFGLIVINIDKAEIEKNCIFQFPIYSVAKHGGYLYAATSKGVYRIQTDKNIQNFQEWEAYPLDEKYKDGGFADEDIRKIAVSNNQLYFLVPGNSLFHLVDDEVIKNTELTAQPIRLEVKGDKMFVFSDAHLWIYTEGGQAPSFLGIGSLRTITSASEDNEYWVGVPDQNLSRIRQNGQSYSSVEGKLRPEGPLTNFPFYMANTGGKIRFVGGGFTANNFNNPALLSEFDSKGWFNYAPPPAWTRDLVSVQANPADPDNIFVASWGLGVYEFKNRAYESLYGQYNSSLTDIFGGTNYVRVDGVKFEGPDKFWICNTNVPMVMNLFEKKNGEWTSHGLDYPEIYTSPSSNRSTTFRDVFIDKNKNKWVAGTGAPTIFVFNENGTIEDISDDKRKLFLKFYDQEGKRLIMHNIYKIYGDVESNIWIVSNTGLFIVDNPNAVFDEDIVLRRIEFAEKENYGSIDYQFARVNVNDMAFDSANRKWVATEENGVYVINERNTEIIAHFTRDNSPLQSDRIASIAVDDNDHTFVGTDKGILEFSGILATDPSSIEAVYAYPNPMSKDFLRNVVVKGLKKETSFKIVDGNNILINRGVTSDRGEIAWNGEDLKGNKVEPAVYYVVGIDTKGVEGILCEIKVIN